MTKEEKARAYDEALEGIEDYIKSLKNVNDGIWSARDIENSLLEIFPQLKESRDEKIRKTLINFFDGWGDKVWDSGIKYSEVIAWLEKQKTSEESLQYLRENHSPSEMSDFQAAMNIAVAKAYDKGYNDGLERQGEQKPAEEYNITGIGSKNAQGKLGEMIKNLKPAEWSEEDKEMSLDAIKYLEIFDAQGIHGDKAIPAINWLKSLKDRVGNFDDGYKVGFSAAKHNQWKPSDAQMAALKEACDKYWEPDGLDPLYTLYQDLKKLKE